MSRNLVKNCMQATGKSLPATLLLMRIAYWSKYAVVVREGQTWIARTQSEWCEETELTPQQVKDAFVLLRKKMLITTQKGVFGGRTIGFVRLTERGEICLETGERECPETPTGQCLETPTLLHGETNIGSSYPSDTTNLPSATPDLLSGEDQAISEIVSKEAPVVTVKEILASGGKHPKPKPSQHLTPTVLGKHWQTEVASAFNIFVPPLTQKQTGQLKHFMNACPADSVLPILSAVIHNWTLFTAAVKSSAGIFKPPAQPNIDFLLKHVGPAVNFGKDAGDLSTVASVGGQVQPEMQLTAQAAPDEKASDDEIEQILGIKLKKGPAPC